MRTAVVLAFGTYIASVVVVLSVVAYGQKCIPSWPEHPSSRRGGIVDSMCAWDGEWYANIATSGYASGQTKPEAIAFFPAYPIFGRAVMLATKLSAEASLLVVSHAFWLGSLVALAVYLRGRDSPMSHSLILYTLLAMAFFPSTFYFRMAYTESMFLFLMIVALYGMRKSWPALAIALVIGLATATRSVGVALLVPFVLHLWKTSGRGLRRPFPHALVFIPVACWGLAAFMGYQIWAFKDPFAFAEAQRAWHVRAAPASIIDRAADLLTLEPIISVYSPTSPCYWRNTAPHDSPVVNLAFANPVFFLGTAILVIIGAYRGWLDRSEWLLSGLLLLIPYIMQSNRMGMVSQARFASVVFPAYIVIGQFLARVPTALAVTLIFGSAILMGAYTALFTSWYFFF